MLGVAADGEAGGDEDAKVGESFIRESLVMLDMVIALMARTTIFWTGVCCIMISLCSTSTIEDKKGSIELPMLSQTATSSPVPCSTSASVWPWHLASISPKSSGHSLFGTSSPARAPIA